MSNTQGENENENSVQMRAPVIGVVGEPTEHVISEVLYPEYKKHIDTLTAIGGENLFYSLVKSVENSQPQNELNLYHRLYNPQARAFNVLNNQEVQTARSDINKSLNKVYEHINVVFLEEYLDESLVPCEKIHEVDHERYTVCYDSRSTFDSQPYPHTVCS